MHQCTEDRLRDSNRPDSLTPQFSRDNPGLVPRDRFFLLLFKMGLDAEHLGDLRIDMLQMANLAIRSILRPEARSDPQQYLPYVPDLTNDTSTCTS